MPTTSPTLHGSAPDKAGVALLLIDFINDLAFPEGDALLPHALAAARAAADMKARARAAGVPVVYVNDNFGRWRSDFHATVAHCRDGGVPGRPLAEALPPTGDDYFVLKPKNSGFYGTTLGLLLEHLGARALVLAGLTGDNCVLFTAHDAYLRGFRLVVPADGVASLDAHRNVAALDQLRRVLKADTPPAARIDFAALAAG